MSNLKKFYIMDGVILLLLILGIQHPMNNLSSMAFNFVAFLLVIFTLCSE